LLRFHIRFLEATMLRCRPALAIALLLAITPLLLAGPYVPAIQKGDISIHLNPIVTGMSAPLYGFSPPGDTQRMFILEQNGLVQILQNGALLPTPALDLRSRVAPPLNPASANDERGLLGIAFHPGFNDPGSVGFKTLYTYTSEPVGAGVTYPAPNNAVQNYKQLISEYKISAGDPNIIDPGSRREIFSAGKNAGNHNGGTVAFGPDGFLYLALGDGGNANDVAPPTSSRVATPRT
jgi:glucose/arabinose dehydrogenase